MKPAACISGDGDMVTGLPGQAGMSSLLLAKNEEVQRGSRHKGDLSNTRNTSVGRVLLLFLRPSFMLSP